ncbi:MAG: beta-lactamase family protein, partial [Bacteroidetes bacterium]|nr:beta-lactamase family protein [Bacteroidota bacterium]
GTQWSYCNTNYAFLAEIVERVSGQSFAEWTRQNIFKPLKMWDSFAQSDCFALIPDRADSYHRNGDAYERSHHLNVDFAGQSHLFSTVDDMVRWLDNFRTWSLGGKMLMTRMVRKGKLNDGEEVFYAAGLGVNKYRGATTIGHSGSTEGFKAAVLYLPEFEVGVVILANVDSINPEKTANRILDIYLRDQLDPLPARPERREKPFIELDPEEYQKFVRGYILEETETRLAMFRSGDRMMGAIHGVGTDYFYPTSKNEFNTMSRNCQVTFFEDHEGRVHRLRIVLKGKEMWADRIEPDSPNDGLLEECGGVYYSDELGVVYELTPRDGKLVLSHRRMGKRMLQFIERDHFVGRLGFLKFNRGDEGEVAGFNLWDEVFGEGEITFEKWRK